MKHWNKYLIYRNLLTSNPFLNWKVVFTFLRARVLKVFKRKLLWLKYSLLLNVINQIAQSSYPGTKVQLKVTTTRAISHLCGVKKNFRSQKLLLNVPVTQLELIDNILLIPGSPLSMRTLIYFFGSMQLLREMDNICKDHLIATCLLG